ncbi:MAG: hypothetical protein KKB13_10110 [Chloroflexi bacterium]|nr:hypothetical protein [Chloroflexota bacterium]
MFNKRAGVALAGMVMLVPAVVARDSTGSVAVARLGPEVAISVPAVPDSHRYQADLAFNWFKKEYLVVWHQTWDDGTRQVWARRMSAAGQPVAAPFRLSNAPNNQIYPAVACNSWKDDYLVVWMYDVAGNGSRYEIRGRIIPWNATGPGTEFVIGDWIAPASMWNPAVTYCGATHNAYMVTWDSYSTETGQPLNIVRRLVAADGTLSASAAVTSSGAPHHSDVAYNWVQDECLVVWVSGSTSIYGARLRWDGTVTRSDFVIYAGSTTVQYPAVTQNERYRYLVAWERQYDIDDWDVYGIELDLNGDTVVGSFGIDYSYDAETRPDVTADWFSGTWLAVWQRAAAAGDAIWASTWPVGGLPSSRFPVTAVAFWNNREPAVAAGPPGNLIVYEGRAAEPTERQHIYGRMWWPVVVYLPLTLKNR